MIALHSATLSGPDAFPVTVEVSLTRGLPALTIVGLASHAIQESRDRIKSALHHHHFKIPAMKVTVNLSPSDVEKQGTHFDLPIALGIMLANESPSPIPDLYIFGELGLNGNIKNTGSIFPLILSLAQGKKHIHVVVPRSGLEKLEIIPNLSIHPVDSLTEAVALLTNPLPVSSKNSPKEWFFPSLEIGGFRYFYHQDFPEDMIDVRGQEVAKRAALIAATGFHNILLEGSPGCGKSMLIKRLRHLLPPLSQEELLEVAKISSLDNHGASPSPLRPFRSPHHTSTRASIFGGGSREARIGEIALSHLGILFFDELLQFPKNILEALREPMQEGRLLISRVNQKITYPTSFLFAGATNPCPCGNLMSAHQECRCSELEIRRYRARLSEPLMDRIDLYIPMHECSAEDRPTISSQELSEQIISAFRFQKDRGQIALNGKLEDSHIEHFCQLDSDAQTTLEQAIARFGISQRGVAKTKKVARTIADLEKSESITKKHLLEALSYRFRDRH